MHSKSWKFWVTSSACYFQTFWPSVQFSSVAQSLQPHRLQHMRLPCPSPTPGACSNSCPSSWWCHPTISSLLSPSPFPSIFPSFRVFSNEKFFALGGRSIRVSASASVFPVNVQDWFALGWTGWISLQSEGLFKSLLQHHSSKASILQHSAFFMVQLAHPYMTTGKIIALTRRTFVGKVMSLLFNMLSRLVIIFLPRNKHLLISWLQSLSAVILEPQETNFLSLFPLFRPSSTSNSMFISYLSTLMTVLFIVWTTQPLFSMWHLEVFTISNILKNHSFSGILSYVACWRPWDSNILKGSHYICLYKSLSFLTRDLLIIWH